MDIDSRETTICLNLWLATSVGAACVAGANQKLAETLEQSNLRTRQDIATEIVVAVVAARPEDEGALEQEIRRYLEDRARSPGVLGRSARAMTRPIRALLARALTDQFVYYL